MKFYDHNDDHNHADEEVKNLNFMKTHFLTKLVQSYRCRFYNVDFVFNNQLHKHLRIIYNKSKFSKRNVVVINFESVNKFIIITATTKAFLSIIFHASKVMHLNITNVTIEEYAFREHRFITILMMFILIRQSYKLCFDTRYIINFIDRKFLLEVFPNIVIKKMLIFITMRDIDVNMHNANEYIRLQIYLSDKNDIIKIKREFHIVDDLAVKALIDINIIKSKDMIFDIKKNVIIIDSCKDIQIFFISVNHHSHIKVTIFNNNKTKMIIPSHFNMIVSITDLKCKSLKLSYDRDFLFES